MKIAHLLFIFSFISAQWSSESAHLLEKNRKEVGLFTPFKMGMNNGSELSINKFLMMPSASLKQEMIMYNSWKMARIFRIEYPTPGLKWLQSPLGLEMGAPNKFSLISTQFSIPQMLSFYTEIIGTHGKLTIGYPPFKNRLQISDKNGFRHECNETFYDRFKDAFLTQIHDFIDSILNKKQNQCTLSNATKATLITSAMTKSFKTKKIIELKDLR